MSPGRVVDLEWTTCFAAHSPSPDQGRSQRMKPYLQTRGPFSSLQSRSVMILQVGRRSAWVDPTRCRRIAPGIPLRAVLSSDAVRLKKPPRHPVCQLTFLAVYCICLPQTDEQETSCGRSAFPISLAIVVWMAESANKTCSTDNCTLRLHGARFVPFSALVSGRFCGLSLFGSDLWMNRRSMKTLNYPFDRHPQRKTQDRLNGSGSTRNHVWTRPNVNRVREPLMRTSGCGQDSARAVVGVLLELYRQMLRTYPW
ncbi:hypothetical protein BDP81DRAFT_69361 [Colletotrichum phormii]|uniref:Uncharacterized protein n=1 Tax=Colletotrichum phormii TaxID=359342 RepID=A0AAI9ZN21_9PEZI|nr:uncharacterized protein BDP81DRAFT_69361 [Colletotrichum phormii]KAK1633662.1 hypothetical protein BDP81DRAFT_69361 [Colletotrichum phormii]